MIPAVTTTRSKPIENYPQRMFRQSYGPKPHAAPASNRNFFHEIKPAVMIPAVTTTRSKPIENYPQQIFRQSYGPNPHATPAANRNFFHEIKPAVMIAAATPPHSRPIEIHSQQTFRLSYGPNHHDKSAVNRKLLHEINSAVMIPAIASTHSRLIGNYSQQILMQPYGSKHHINSATNRIFFYEINPAVMISAAKSQTCNISIQFSGSCDQSANFLNKRNHNHADDSPHNSHHQFYLITSVHGNNPSQEGLSLVDLSHPPSCIEKAMQQTPIWKANSSPLTQTERLKAVGVSKISKYSDTHTPMGCSLWTCVSLYAHSGRIYPPMLTMYLCIPAVLTTDLCILLCSRQTCTSLCAHYGPVFPPMLTTVTSIYITGHRKPNPHHPTAAHNTTHTTYHTHHTSRMATPPPVVSNHTPTLLLPHLTYIIYTPSHPPPYTKAQSLTPRRQTCARAVSQTTVTATCPHCSYPDCTQLRPDHHTSLLHARTQIHPYATTNTCHPKPGLCAAKPCTNQHATLCQSCQSTPGTPVYQC